MAGPITERISELLRDGVSRLPPQPGIDDLNSVLRLLARWRSQLIANTYVRHHGPKVLQGPFAGFEYVTMQTEGALIPRLLGTYECELHPHFQAFADEGVDCVIDVGCAEGYYAVGLARLMPKATVYAYDIEARAREACALHAEANGVKDRVVVGGEFTPQDFQAFEGRHALVLVDCEGAEDDILKPDLGPALARMNVIVETHDCFRPGVKARLIERFSPTHDITVVDLGPKTMPLPAWLHEFAHLDQLLAVWEWRSAPTPWLVMRPKG